MMPTWLNCLNRSFRSTRHRHSRKHAAGRPELLEQRTYLSVSSLVSNSQLIIVSDGDDSIEVRSDPGGSGQVQVVVNGLLDNTLPVLQASEVSRIEIDAGPGDNLIDLNAITAADFSFVDGANGNGLQIMVDAGDGQDTVFGSQSFGDVLVGGDGQDVINVQAVNQILGDQIIEGGDGNDTLSGGSGSDTIRGGDGDDLIVGDEFSAVAPIPGVGADVLSGGDGNDTIQGEAGDDSIHGNMGEDSLLGGPGNDTINGDSGQDVIQGQAGADFLLGGGGADALNGNDGADTLLGNGGDDTLLGGTGPDSLQGGNGNDALDTGDQFLSVDDVIVNPEGDFGFSSAVFTVSLSDLSALDVSFDVATVDGLAVDGLDYLGVFRRVTIPAGQLQVAVSVPVLGDTVAETTENFFLTLSNAENAVIGGAGQASIIDDGDGPVQVVFLDFDTATEVDEVQFTQTMRDAIQQNMAADFGAFNVVFTQMQPTGDFTTVLFNEEPFFGPGGLASDGIDFRNLSFNDTVILKPDGFFGFPGAPPFTEATIISSNSNIAAHELGHAMGLRHRDSFGPIGSGVPAGLEFLFTPPYSGPVSAVETDNHIMATPALNQPLSAQANDLFFGARASIKLSAYAFEGQVLQEQSQPHFSVATAQQIVLADLTVPNLEQSGPFVGLQFDVEATTVLGQIDTPGLSDFFSFTAAEGDTVNLEVMSEVLAGQNPPRFTNTIDPILSVFDDSGSLVALGSGVAVNGDEIESSDSVIIDLLIPSDGTYFIEVEATSPVDSGSYELFLSTFNAVTAPTVGNNGFTPPVAASDTMDGGSGNDTLASGSAADLLIGGADNDSLFSGGGNDVLYGGGGRDVLDGGEGNDSVFGQGSNDTVQGGAGDDFVDGGVGLDSVYGDDLDGQLRGNDTVVGGAMNDLLFGGDGEDFLFGGSGRDILNGGDGADSLFGQGSNDVVRGEGGNDTIVWKGDGNDTFDAGEGMDLVDVRGSGGFDQFEVRQSGSTLQVMQDGSSLSFPNADDNVSNAVEQVRIAGMAGNDRLAVSDINNVGSLVLVMDGGTGNDTITASNALLGTVRLLLDGGEGDDVITGSADADTITGGDGDDVINAGTGADTVRGDAGDDTIDGQMGNDFVDGGLDNDQISGSDGNDSLEGGFGNDSLSGGNGVDTLRGGFGDDSLSGDLQADLIHGDTGRDTLIGGGGHDTLDGGREADILLGNSGHDKLRGDHGDDIIRGGSGDDIIDGGDGDDRIFAGGGNDGIQAGDGNDTVVGDLGADIIIGSDGDDLLLGGGGIDTILAGDGDDSVNGNSGNDTLSLGEGLNQNGDTVFILDEAFTLTPELLARLDASD